MRSFQLKSTFFFIVVTIHTMVTSFLFRNIQQPVLMRGASTRMMKRGIFSQTHNIMNIDQRLYSTKTPLMEDTKETTVPIEKKIKHLQNHRVVVVNRGRQSMAFRQGSPLVFSGAISYTCDLIDGNNNNSNNNVLESGMLVSVATASKNDKLGSSSSSGTGKQRQRKPYYGKGKSNNGKADTQPSFKHYSSTLLFGDNIQSSEKRNNVLSSVSDSQLIGIGVYNPHSMYRVRILCHETSHPKLFRKICDYIQNVNDDGETTQQQQHYDSKVLEMIMETKLKDAIASRKSLRLIQEDTDGEEKTDSFRLINGEGDGLSGLAIDILGGNVAVLMSSAAWCEYHKSTLENIVKEVLSREMPDITTLIWRRTESRLKQDGIDVLEEDDYDDDMEDSCVIVTESGIQYKTFPWSGQKTGFYCDQRENRVSLGKLCKGKRVLDLCCYNGGFALNAAKYGAISCTGVDSSQDAVDVATENAVLNGYENICTFVRSDISTFMKQAMEEGQEYDIIILDPPKLAPSVSGLDKASRKYHAFNRDAMKLINGMFIFCDFINLSTFPFLRSNNHFFSLIHSSRWRITLNMFM